MRVSWLRLRRLLVEGLIGLLVAVASPAQTPPQEGTAPKTLDAALAQAAARHTPLLLLVAESGQSHADDAALSLVQSSAVRRRTDSLTVLILDLGVSRNRAVAARFHPIRTPLLLCLSPGGVVISRDEQRLSKKLVLQRTDEALREAPSLDARLAALKSGLKTNGDQVAGQLQLANFLLDHGNAQEAIPYFSTVAHNTADAEALRVRAWVALARAHLWIGEPEKAREEARDLAASLGSRMPEARAGAELILGIHDANLKRPALARQEFEEAIAAAPASSYAKEAVQLMQELRKGWTIK